MSSRRCLCLSVLRQPRAFLSEDRGTDTQDVEAYCSFLPLFPCRLFFGRKMLPIVLGKPTSAQITLCGRRRQHRKGYLCDFHAWMKDYRNIVLVRYFQGDVKHMPRIHDTSRIVDHEPDSGQRGFAAQLYEVMIGTKE